MSGPLRDARGRFVAGGGGGGTATQQVEGGSFTVDVKPGFGDDWQKSDECRQTVAAAARIAAGHASRMAPDNPRTSVDIKSSIEGRAEQDDDGRWYGLVVVGDWKGHLYEFGSSRQKARPYLRPGAEAAGLSFEAP